VRKASGFPSSSRLFGGYAARGEASTFPIVFRKAGGIPHGKRQSRNQLPRGRSRKQLLGDAKTFCETEKR